jgi:hypothetical protein
MGAYVSTSACKENYNVTINCNLTYLDPNDNHTEIVRIGDVDKGQFPGNPDIAGVGVSLEMKLAFLH